MNNKKILPQANDLDKVIDVMTYVHYNPGCSIEDVAEYIGFTTRQGQYYRDAAVYLGLINKDLTPTALCEEIFKFSPANIQERVYERIITDNLMGQVFAKTYVLPEEDLDEFAYRVCEEEFPEIESEATLQRRSHNIVSWSKRIIEEMENKRKSK